jgi:hypothetical protein
VKIAFPKRVWPFLFFLSYVLTFHTTALVLGAGARNRSRPASFLWPRHSAARPPSAMETNLFTLVVRSVRGIAGWTNGRDTRGRDAA